MEVNNQKTCRDLTNCQVLISPNGRLHIIKGKTVESILLQDRKNPEVLYNEYVLDSYNCVHTAEGFKKLMEDLIVKENQGLTTWTEILHKCGYLAIHYELDQSTLKYDFTFPNVLTDVQDKRFLIIFSMLHKYNMYKKNKANAKRASSNIGKTLEKIIKPYR